MFELEVEKLLKNVGIKEVEFETPPQKEFGDIAFPCFQLAKKEKKNPVEIAKNIASKIKTKDTIFTKVEARGPYVNIFFDWEKISEKILKQMLKFKMDLGKGKKVMVEYSQPNPVHPMHIGHARTTFLGDAVANVLDFVGYKVVKANYMNDTGLQVAKLVAAYLEWAKGKKPEGKPDFWLWQYYVKYHEEENNNPSLEEKAREILRKVELEENKAAKKVWDQIVDWCIEGFEQTYKRVGVNFDVYLHESKFRKAGKKLVEAAIKKGIASKNDEGAIVAGLEKYDLKKTIILRSDGTGLYVTSDLGMTLYKFEKYKLDKAIWVVSSEQNLYFQQLFKIFELLGYKFFKNCYHLSFDLVRLSEGKMSSREGRAVMLDEVVSKIVDLAYQEVSKRNSELTEKEKIELAEKIGIGALKYAIVRIEPENQIIFDWNQMLSFDGNTGPYLQYAHTRCSSILKKAGKWKPNYSVEVNEHEKELLKTIMKFPEAVEHAAKEMKPYLICNYAYELATTFANFYEKCPVLKAEQDTKNFRLTLVQATKIGLEKSLNLIGIQVPEKM